MDPIIDGEFKALIPPLSTDKSQILEQSILNEGVEIHLFFGMAF
jgi:hypothetical protein